MFLAGPPNTFQYLAGSNLTTQPPANGGSAWGVTVTPGNNTYGAWAQLIAAVTYSCFYIEINFNSITTAAAVKDCIANIGIDPAGGTSYTTLIPHLLCSDAQYTAYTGHWGVSYQFPVFIPAGSSIACQMSVNNATVGTGRCNIKVYGQPSRPELVKFGTSVEALGITAATSTGTTVTSGTTSEGAWTSLGTTTARGCFIQFGVKHTASAISNESFHADLSFGGATGKIIVMQDAQIYLTISESVSMIQPPAWCDIPSGSTIYGRLQCGDTPTAGIGMAAYVVRE